jgi:hypothetical protein
MTERKHSKRLVRARMEKTGEAYATARRNVIRQDDATPHFTQRLHHFPGNTPGPTALRALLAGAGVRAPHTKLPFSEAMVFGIAGGIGAGVFAFHYAKENFSSFFIAGRNQWQDHKGWALGATKRLGLTAIVRESSGVKPGETQLRELLSAGRPVMIWLTFRGKQYHLATVHAIDDGAGVARLGDLGDELIPVPLADLAAARGYIKKDKNRALAIEPATSIPALRQLVHGGISTCVASLTTCKMKNFRLDAFKTWADRLDGSQAADSWARIFPPGRLMYQGLRSVTEYIEYYGTGGGLCRPLFAEFLGEAADELGDRTLKALSERYAELGRQWSALADAALPDPVPMFRKAKEALRDKAEVLAAESDGAGLSLCEAAMGRIEAEMQGGFPLSAAESAALRRELKGRVTALYEGEVAALDALGGWL